MSMKNKFPGYYPPTKEEEKALWGDAIFVFDTCSLLNLYSYSNSTRDELLQVLEKIKDRLWMPYQVAAEFHKNRAVRLSAECKNYSDAIKLVKKFTEDIDQKHRTKRGHPFVTDSSMALLSEGTEKVLGELEKERKSLEKQLRHDPLFDRICNLYDDRVGDAYDAERHARICKEGKERYKSKIPPGFEDEKEKLEPDMYGDLFLWNELMDYAKEKKSNVVLVTDDGKKDWWHIAEGDKPRIIGPRPELIAEFASKTTQSIWIYSGERFVHLAGDLVETAEVTEDAKAEVKAAAVDAKRRDAKRFRSSAFSGEGIGALKDLMEQQRQFTRDVSRLFGEGTLTEMQKQLKSFDDLQSISERARREIEAQENVRRKLLGPISSNMNDLD